MSYISDKCLGASETLGCWVEQTSRQREIGMAPVGREECMSELRDKLVSKVIELGEGRGMWSVVCPEVK